MLIAAGANLNRWSEPEGQNYPATPLTVAVEHGQREMIQVLLEAGARINLTKAERENIVAFYGGAPTALFRTHDPQLVELLLDAGADPNIGLDLDEDLADELDGATRLEQAIANDELAIARTLLAHGARFLVSGAEELVRAIEEDNAEMVRLLFEHGARPPAATEDRKSVV